MGESNEEPRETGKKRGHAMARGTEVALQIFVYHLITCCQVVDDICLLQRFFPPGCANNRWARFLVPTFHFGEIVTDSPIYIRAYHFHFVSEEGGNKFKLQAA